MKSTVSGAIPVCGLALIAGLGARQPPPPPPPELVSEIADLTGNTEVAETFSCPPTMDDDDRRDDVEPAGQRDLDLVADPVSSSRRRRMSVNVGVAGVAGIRVAVGRLRVLEDLVLVLVDLVALSGSVGSTHASALFAAKLAAIRVMFWRLIQPR